jgi:pimeloyl-ACP methyl ester carboxylesterase
LRGGWRATYVVGALIALYLNVVVLVVQSFQKLTFLQPLAPTQSEPPFLAVQVAVLAAFLSFGYLAIPRFGVPSKIPEGTVTFDGFRSAHAANRAQFFLDIASGPFYGFNRDGANVSQGIIQNWWRQGMMGGTKPQYDCIKAFSETDFTDDLKQIDVPVLIMHGDDDQIVPIGDSALLSIKLVKNGTLKVYRGQPHGMCTTHPDIINPDLLAFIRE